MADKDETSMEASAEKAYAAAAEATANKPKVEKSPESPAEAMPVEFPPAAMRTSDTSAPAGAAKPAPAKPAAKSAPAKPRKTVKAAPAKAKKAARPAKAPALKAKSPAAAPAKPKRSVSQKAPTPSKSKEKQMPTQTKTTQFTDGVKKVMTDSQEKAKLAFEKSTALFGEYTEFTKGNVEAFVESGKILASGLQHLGSDLAAEGRTSFETMTSDVKQLAGVKSPSEFLKLQTDIMRRNVDTAVSYGSKNTEAMLKLANDAFAPISGRFSLAMEKIRKAA